MNIKFLSIILFFNFSFICAQYDEKAFYYSKIESALNVFASTEVEISEEAKIDDNIAQKIRGASEQSQIMYKQTLLKGWEYLSRAKVSSIEKPVKDCDFAEHTRLSNIVFFFDEQGVRQYREDDVAIANRLDAISLLCDRKHTTCCCFDSSKRIPTKDELERERQLLVNALFNRLKTIQEQTQTMNSSIATAIEVKSPLVASAPFIATVMEIDRSEECFFSKK